MNIWFHSYFCISLHYVVENLQLHISKPIFFKAILIICLSFLSTLAKIVYFYPNIPTLVSLAKGEGKISKKVTNIHFIIVYISSPHCPAVYTAVTLLKNDWLKCKFKYHPTTSKSTYQKKKKCNSTINDNVEIQLVLMVQDLVRGKRLPTQILFLCTLREFDNEFFAY